MNIEYLIQVNQMRQMDFYPSDAFFYFTAGFIIIFPLLLFSYILKNIFAF